MLFLCFLSGNKYQQKGNLRVARHRDLLPKRLGSSLCNRVRKLDPDVLKHVLTALMITRNIALHGTPPDYSTITNGRVPELTVQLKKFVTREIRRKNWKVSLRPFSSFLSTSMGPNGPAMLSCYDDLNLLSQEMKESLLQLTQDSAERQSYFLGRDNFV
jgi:hypothetical protein